MEDLAILDPSDQELSLEDVPSLVLAVVTLESSLVSLVDMEQLEGCYSRNEGSQDLPTPRPVTCRDRLVERWEQRGGRRCRCA